MKKQKRTKLLFRVARVVLLAALVVQALAVASPVLADEPDPGGRGGQIVGALRQIAQIVIDIFIGIATILLAVGIVTGFVGGQFMVTVGHPFGLSQAWTKVIAVVILGIGAMLTIVIVNTVIDVMASLIPATVIPSV